MPPSLFAPYPWAPGRFAAPPEATSRVWSPLSPSKSDQANLPDRMPTTAERVSKKYAAALVLTGGDFELFSVSASIRDAHAALAPRA
jgi:hypothetical protein